MPRLVIYKMEACIVRMVYCHWLHLEMPDGTLTMAKFGDPELDRTPSAEDLKAIQRNPSKRKRR